MSQECRDEQIAALVKRDDQLRALISEICPELTDALCPVPECRCEPKCEGLGSALKLGAKVETSHRHVGRNCTKKCAPEKCDCPKAEIHHVRVDEPEPEDHRVGDLEREAVKSKRADQRLLTRIEYLEKTNSKLQKQIDELSAFIGAPAGTSGDQGVDALREAGQLLTRNEDGYIALPAPSATGLVLRSNLELDEKFEWSPIESNRFIHVDRQATEVTEEQQLTTEFAPVIGSEEAITPIWDDSRLKFEMTLQIGDKDAALAICYFKGFVNEEEQDFARVTEGCERDAIVTIKFWADSWGAGNSRIMRLKAREHSGTREAYLHQMRNFVSNAAEVRPYQPTLTITEIRNG